MDKSLKPSKPAPSPIALQWLSLQLDPLVSVTDAAQLLGCHRATVVRYIHEGRLPAAKLGGKRGFFKMRKSRVMALLLEEHERES